MRMRQLRYFEAVAEELHFGKAAERLHIQQPPLSRQIQSLEEELGTQLFNRTNRKVELTEAGKYFLDEAKEMLKNDSRARATLQAMGDGTAGKLHVGFVYLVLSSAFPDIVGRFIRKYPAIDVELHDETSYEQIEAVRDGSRHVGFVTLNLMDLQDLSHVVVQCTNPRAAIPTNHPLAQKEILTLEDLADFPYICSRESYCKMRVKEMEKLFLKAGLELKLGMKYRRKHTGTVFVAAGLGWTIINDGSERTMPQGVALRPIEADLPPFEVGMIWNPNRITPLIDNFLSFYKEQVRE
ncbi:transcriptional regulator, LysR family [Maridesulfovibrio ferrireducens]|uniref:Transcriptional regulator, LysR family n=1 Tax=Maridesulfovibrio ferrireducens TaxID=246191 RepID=A0A1G9J3B8_9BACT|nr:LysR substrate-binding domain-containing protein [Maridesulfovibrio ferrireducens]SDL31990.1 transcriptional regulator, LysR family [Maridesulfovibrio ferrireducens]